MKFCSILLISIMTPFLSYADHPAQTTIALVTEHLPPHHYYDNSRQIKGYITEVVTAAMTSEHIPFTINIYPWARSYNLALNKEETCIFSMVRTKEREQKFKWVHPLIYVKSTLWALKKDNIKINSLNDVKAYTVATIRNSFAHSTLLNNGFIDQKNLYVVDSTNSVVKLLYTRPEIHFIVAAYSTIYYEAHSANVPFDELKYMMDISDNPLSLYLSCSLKTSDETVQKIRNGFSKIKKSGQLGEINSEWKKRIGDNLIKVEPY